MSERFDVRDFALTLGILFVIIHVVGILVMLATYGSVFHWAINLHFIDFSFSVMSFDPINFAISAILAFIVGVVIGGLFAALWNWISRR